MTEMVSRRPKLRYRWSHRHPAHRAIVRSANRILPYVPFSVKYGLTGLVRSRALPYKLVRPGSAVVQVGAPRDTLLAGRSRAMTFILRAGHSGVVLVVEPDPESVASIRAVVAARSLQQARVVEAGAWSHRTTLTLEVDPDHPAANFTDGTAAYSKEEQRRFQRVAMRVAPMDDLIEEARMERVDLVSITTNGAESRVLAGLARTLKRDRPYVCLAQTSDGFESLMRDVGYELMGADDRGATFCSTKGPHGRG